MVKEFQINYKGKKGSQQGDQEDEDEEDAKKKVSKCPVHYQDHTDRIITKLVASPRKCKHAHNPIELELIKPQAKI